MSLQPGPTAAAAPGSSETFHPTKWGEQSCSCSQESTGAALGDVVQRVIFFCRPRCFLAVVVRSYLKIISLIRKQKMTFYGLLVL